MINYDRGVVKNVTKTAVINIVLQRTLIGDSVDVRFSASQQTFSKVTTADVENYIS